MAASGALKALLLGLILMGLAISMRATPTGVGTARPNYRQTSWATTASGDTLGNVVKQVVHFDGPDLGGMFLTLGKSNVCPATPIADAKECICSTKDDLIVAGNLNKTSCHDPDPSQLEVLRSLVGDDIRSGNARFDPRWGTQEELDAVERGSPLPGWVSRPGALLSRPTQSTGMGLGVAAHWIVTIYYSPALLRDDELSNVLLSTPDLLEVSVSAFLHQVDVYRLYSGTPSATVQTHELPLKVRMRLSAGLELDSVTPASFVGTDVSGVFSTVYSRDGGSINTFKTTFPLTDAKGAFFVMSAHAWYEGDTEALNACSTANIDAQPSATDDQRECYQAADEPLCELSVFPPTAPGGHSLGVVRLPMLDKCPVRGQHGQQDLHVAALICNEHGGVRTCNPTHTVFQNPRTTVSCDPYVIDWDVRHFFSFFSFIGMWATVDALISATNGFGREIKEEWGRATQQLSVPLFQFVLRGGDALINILSIFHAKVQYCVGFQCLDVLNSVSAETTAFGDYVLRGRSAALCPAEGVGGDPEKGVQCYSEDLMVLGKEQSGRMARYTPEALDGKGAGQGVLDTWFSCKIDSPELREDAGVAGPMFVGSMTSLHPTSPGTELEDPSKSQAFVVCAFPKRIAVQPGDTVYIKMHFYVLLSGLRRLSLGLSNSTTSLSRVFEYTMPVPGATPKNSTLGTLDFTNVTFTVHLPATKQQVCNYTSTQAERLLLSRVSNIFSDLKHAVSAGVKNLELVGEISAVLSGTPCDTSNRRLLIEIGNKTMLVGTCRARVAAFNRKAFEEAALKQGITVLDEHSDSTDEQADDDKPDEETGGGGGSQTPPNPWLSGTGVALISVLVLVTGFLIHRANARRRNNKSSAASIQGEPVPDSHGAETPSVDLERAQMDRSNQGAREEANLGQLGAPYPQAQPHRQVVKPVPYSIVWMM